MSRKRDGPVSPLKILLAFMTCGLSLPFVGIRKKVREIKANDKFNSPKSCVNNTQWPPAHLDVKDKWFFPGYLTNAQAIALSALAVMFLLMGAFQLSVVAYIIMLALSDHNKKKQVAAEEERRCSIECQKQLPYNEETQQGTAGKQNRQQNQPETEMERVDRMDGHAFEYYVADLLRHIGYINVEVTKGSGDQGVDVLAEKDGIRYAIQCKNYSHALGNTPVQEVAAGRDFYNCHVGVVITNNHFTSSGKELAQKVRVLLWDRDVLEQMIKQARLENQNVCTG